MTSNQINMLRYLEEVRHNEATENETYRSNVAREKELYRSNISREIETNRSNIMSERLRSLELSELSRHNLMNEHIGTANALEAQRHNVVTEKESYRHNSASEYATHYLLEPNKKLLEAQAGSTGLNAIVNVGKAVGGLIGWLAQG